MRGPLRLCGSARAGRRRLAGAGGRCTACAAVHGTPSAPEPREASCAAVAQVWRQLFRQAPGLAPEVLTGPCCAEFMASRERILPRSRCACGCPTELGRVSARLQCFRVRAEALAGPCARHTRQQPSALLADPWSLARLSAAVLDQVACCRAFYATPARMAPERGAGQLPQRTRLGVRALPLHPRVTWSVRAPGSVLPGAWGCGLTAVQLGQPRVR